MNRRRRYAAGAFIVLIICIALIACGATGRKIGIMEVVVMPGQGIDDLHRLYGYGRADAYRAEVRKLNGMQDSMLRAGQRIILPVEE